MRAAPAERETNRVYLEHTSLGLTGTETILDAGTYRDLITSDSATAGRTVNAAGGGTYETKTIKTVSGVNAVDYGDDHQAGMRHTYHENLANNYLEAISNLNAVLNNVWKTAQLAENRKAEEATFQTELAAAYDPNDLTAAKAALTAKKVDAESRKAAHSDAKIQESQDSIGATKTALTEAARDYAGAGRRNQLRNMALTAYLEQVYRGIADEMDAAEQEYNTLSGIASGLRTEYTTKNQQYAGALEDLAQRGRELDEKADAYTTRVRVQEYAETPYLYAKSEDANGGEPDGKVLEEWHGDAEEEYERAKTMLTAAQTRLNEAAYEVQTEDRLPEFMNVVALWEAAGRVDLPALTAAEQTTLATLRDRKYNKHETLDMTDANILQQLEERDLFQRNKELIQTRAEHIKHTMRLVRISKAKELIEAEITRRRMIAQEKEAQFQRELSARFKVDESQEAGVEARNAVYARMAMLVETGGSFYNEFKSWYWGSREYISDFAGANASTALGSLFATTNLTITMNQILEGMSGQWMAGDKSVADKTMIGKWMGMGGEIAEYGGFRQLYFQFMLSIGIWDQKRLEYQITKTTWDPVSQAGQRLIDTGNRIPFGAGGGLVSMGRGMKGQASTEIMKALLQYQIAEYIMRRQYNGANEMADRARSNTIRVMEAQKEYEDALAELYYFTRVPDAKTLKERMIQYGAQNAYEAAGPGDPTTGALYGLTEEDLAYMFDDAGYRDSSGNTYDPEDKDVDEAEMLNVTGLKYEVEYRDAFGRRYDPGVQTGGQPGALEGGWYKGGDGNYTRIRISNHNRSKEYRYNRSIAEDADGHMVYDMGTVLESAMAHAENLRADRAAKYTAAGNAVAAGSGDEHFTFSERDKTFGDLFNAAAGSANGGREFSGYRVTYEDYLNNSMAVQDRELGQRKNVQLKDWQLKETELMQQYQNWEDRTATILERGKRGWSDAESQYLQGWRQWERETDQEIAAAKKEWDAKVKEHFENKQEWETKVRSEASEATIKTVLGQAVDSLNAQLSASAGNVGMIDRTAAIAQAIDEMRQSMPSGAENLKSINKNIQNFNTTLSIAEMIGANVEADLIDVSGRFRAQMEEQQESMKILANVKIFEQYRQLIEDFKYSITVQNEEIEAQTMAAALGEGYQRQGDIYVKQGDASSSYGIVNAYKWFDVDNAMDSELGKTGFTAMKGNDLVNFLKGRSNTEVEAYFYTQKLAVQTAIGNIQGHGTGDQRSWATDAHTLGLFGHWVGRASNSMGDSSGLPMESLMTRAAGSGEDRDPEQIANAVAMMGAGFGELGAFSQRPGGAPLGFYPQLGVMSRYVQKTDNEWIANGKAFRRAESFETPGDLKGDAFDRMNAKMKEADELNDAWKRNDGDLTKMWKQGYLDSYDTGLMKHSDFSAQQGAYQDKYGFLQKQPSASERAMEQLGKKAVEVTAKSVSAAATTTGAMARAMTNPTDPGAWVQMFSSMASSAGQVYGAMTSFAGDALSMGGAGGIGATLRGAGAQLEAAGQQIGAAGDHLALELELSNDPISGLMRQFDPVRMIKNSVWNTELAAQMDGKGRGYMAEAQLINIVKQPLAIAGSMLVAAGVGAGSTGVGSVPGAIVAAIGAAVVTLANSTHVDVRTGERSVKMTDQAALQSAIAILTAFAGGMATQSASALAAQAGTQVSGSFTSQLGAQLAMQSTLGAGTQTAMSMAGGYISGMANCDAKGACSGFHNIDSAQGQAAAIRALATGAGSLAGGYGAQELGGAGGGAFTQGFTNSLVSGAIGKSVGAFGEYAIQQMVGARYAGLEAMRRTDLSAGLGMLAGAAVSGWQASLAAEGNKEMQDIARNAHRGNKTNEAKNILIGLGVVAEKREEELARWTEEFATEAKLNEKTLTIKQGADFLNSGRRAQGSGYGEWNGDFELLAAMAEGGDRVSMAQVLEALSGTGGSTDFQSPEFKGAMGSLMNEQANLEKMKAVAAFLKNNPQYEYKNGAFVMKAGMQPAIVLPKEQGTYYDNIATPSQQFGFEYDACAVDGGQLSHDQSGKVIAAEDVEAYNRWLMSQGQAPVDITRAPILGPEVDKRSLERRYMDDMSQLTLKQAGAGAGSWLMGMGQLAEYLNPGTALLAMGRDLYSYLKTGKTIHSVAQDQIADWGTEGLTGTAREIGQRNVRTNIPFTIDVGTMIFSGIASAVKSGFGAMRSLTGIVDNAMLGMADDLGRAGGWFARSPSGGLGSTANFTELRSTIRNIRSGNLQPGEHLGSGMYKDVFLPDGQTDFALAIAHGPSASVRKMTLEEIPLLRELNKSGIPALRGIRVGEILNPKSNQPGFAYLMPYVNGPSSRNSAFTTTLRGLEGEARIQARNDLLNLRAFSEKNSIYDLQGLLDKRTGKFYVNDPMGIGWGRPDPRDLDYLNDLLSVLE